MIKFKLYGLGRLYDFWERPEIFLNFIVKEGCPIGHN